MAPATIEANAPAGDYPLRVSVDPSDLIVEGDQEPNIALIPVSL